MESSELSVFIPTYKRNRELKEALDSLIPQVKPYNIPIIISNNSINTATKDLVESYSYAELFFYENEENLGIDLNMLKSLELCKTRYCLMLGDDDLLLEGGIKYLLEEVNEDFSGVIFNSYSADTNSNIKGITLKKENLRFIETKGTLKRLWNKMHFGTLLLNIEEAQKLPLDEFVGTLHAYSAIPFILLSELKLPIFVLSKPIVLLRDGDKTYQPSIAKVLLVDCVKWLSLMEKYYGNEAIEIKNDYFKKDFSTGKLLKYLNYEGIEISTFSEVPSYLKNKIKIILSVPFIIRRVIVSSALLIKRLI
ncbi:MAG: glycosyltransferase involved in cell wall biosynthesis [Bacteriovoracaceae bacterium]|jgi:glycosyltransferase involved in cell wall biosynthesis